MCDRMADESSTLDIGTEEFVESMKNKNTEHKTFSDHKILMKSLHNYDGFRAVDGIPMTELYKLLTTIFMTVKKIMEERVSISHTQKQNKIEQIYFQRMKYKCFTGEVNSEPVTCQTAC